MEIKYLLFDCDNTLVLSEDVASEICCDLINKILREKGVAVRYSPENLICEFVGFNFRRIMVILEQRLDFKLGEDELKYYTKIQEDRVNANIKAKTQPCPGVMEVLAKLHKSGKYAMVIASSSSLRRIRTCLETTGLTQFFDEDRIFSAADSLPVPLSKPDPAIYVHALNKLGAQPDECLTVEDSMSGARAALGASLKCLGYVGSTQTSGQKHEMASHLLSAGCTTVMWDWKEYEKHLSEIEARK